MNTIHEKAVVSKKAELGENNTISPNVVIEEGVVIGDNNTIGPGVVILKGTTIGNGNLIHAGAVLGDLPQDRSFEGAETFLEIGNNNRIREYCTIHRGTKEGSKTVIKDDTFLMGYTHVAHNCFIGTGVNTVNASIIGGYVEIQDYAFLSAIVCVHQFCRIGKYALVSALSAVNTDIPPYLTVGGRPAAVIGPNVVGLKRAGFTPEVRKEIKNAYKILYREGLNRINALARIKEECTSEAVNYFVNFVQNAKRGIAADGDKDDISL